MLAGSASAAALVSAGVVPGLRAIAASSPDANTVALVFGTIDFEPLLSNWACHALHLGIRWFILVAMDDALHASLSRRPILNSHVVLLPGNRTITKLNVIGERQRFGLTLLEAGLNIVHTDADALWLRDPTPLFRGGDVVAERIWGKPSSVVTAWGAGICTGFYYLRSTPAVRALARSVRDEIHRKRSRQPAWQASDQFFVNVVLHRLGVTWRGGAKMLGMTDINTRFHDPNATIGDVVNAPHGSMTIVMLAHVIVPRACPVLSPAELRSLADASPRRTESGRQLRAKTRTHKQRHAPARLRGKALFWRKLLDTSYVLHCFPPVLTGFNWMHFLYLWTDLGSPG